MDQFRFADFILDRRKRQLLRGADVVRIGARAFDLIEVLVAHRDRIVTQDELMAAVWPGTVVGDNNLNVQVANLRRLLGPDAIVTVPAGARCLLRARPPAGDPGARFAGQAVGRGAAPRDARRRP